LEELSRLSMIMTASEKSMSASIDEWVQEEKEFYFKATY
jgi:hypothetical protein